MRVYVVVSIANGPYCTAAKPGLQTPDYATFTFPMAGTIEKVILTHVSGDVTCGGFAPSKWGKSNLTTHHKKISLSRKQKKKKHLFNFSVRGQVEEKSLCFRIL